MRSCWLSLDRTRLSKARLQQRPCRERSRVVGGSAKPQGDEIVPEVAARTRLRPCHGQPRLASSPFPHCPQHRFPLRHRRHGRFLPHRRLPHRLLPHRFLLHLHRFLLHRFLPYRRLLHRRLLHRRLPCRRLPCRRRPPLIRWDLRFRYPNDCLRRLSPRLRPDHLHRDRSEAAILPTSRRRVPCCTPR